MQATMKDASRDEVRHRFEWDAKNFDAIYRLERSRASRWFNQLFRKAVFQRYDITFAQAGNVTDKSILDIGCGSGIYAVDFARRGAKRVLGVDFSGNMLTIAREEAERQHVDEICEFRQADFSEATFEETFDVSIAMGVFDYLPNPAPFLKKMASVTRGKVIASFPTHSLLREPARKLRYKLTRRGTVHFYDQRDIEALASGAGFKSYEMVRMNSSGGGYVLVGYTAVETG
jgi:2-polyprenyl-3-methyl-5-hydroxy-6-metoxy-1,4-benzoquinol methylase